MIRVLSGKVANSRIATSVVIVGLRGATLTAKFALSLFIARFLGLGVLGVYGLVAGLAVVVPAAASLGLINTLSRNAVTQPLPEVTGLLYRYGAIQAAIYTVGFVGVLAVAPFFPQWPLALVVVAIVFLEQINDDLFMVLTHLRYPRLANILIFIRSAAWILLYIPLAFASPSLRHLHALLGFWLGGCAVAFIAFAYATRAWPWRSPHVVDGVQEWFVRAVHDSWRLYSINMVNMVGQYLDRYLVGLFLGLQYTGVYVLFWSIGNALSNLISTSVIQIAEPHLILAHREQSKEYWRLFRRLMVETLLGAMGLAIAAGALIYVVLPYIDRPLAMQFLPVFWLILFGAVLRVAYEVQGVVFYSRHQDWLTLATALLVLAAAALLNLALVPLLSLYGAAAAIIAAYTLGLVARRLIIKWRF